MYSIHVRNRCVGIFHKNHRSHNQVVSRSLFILIFVNSIICIQATCVVPKICTLLLFLIRRITDEDNTEQFTHRAAGDGFAEHGHVAVQLRSDGSQQVHQRRLFLSKHRREPSFLLYRRSQNRAEQSPRPYYPYAGRLSRDSSGRLQIACNGDGALLVEAEADLSLDDLGGFTPRNEFSELVPKINAAAPGSEVQNPDEISKISLLNVQVTSFKCGGVGLGIASMHKVADGMGALQLINAWSEITRGVEISVMPVMDRSLLKARNPPTPKFQHIELQPPPYPSAKIPQSREISVGMFNFASEQINALKMRATESSGGRSYTRFKMLASHVWSCASMARNLDSDETTFMYVSTDGRNRLSPPLPRRYFGNVVLHAISSTKAGDLVSWGLSYGADVIHDGVMRIDDEYVRSAVDHLEVNPFVRSGAAFGSPNIKMNNWSRLPLYDADFGWGRPAHVGLVRIPFDGSGYLMRNPLEDGSLSVALALQSRHMDKFKAIIYDISV